MRSDEIRARLEPMYARRTQLQKKAAALAEEIGSLRAADTGDGADQLDRLLALSRDQKAIADEIELLERQAEPIRQQLGEIMNKEAVESANAALQDATAAAVAAHDALKEAVFRFLRETLPPLIASVEDATRRGDAAARSHQIAAERAGLSASGAFGVNLNRTGAEANLISQLVFASRHAKK